MISQADLLEYSHRYPLQNVYCKNVTSGELKKSVVKLNFHHSKNNHADKEYTAKRELLHAFGSHSIEEQKSRKSDCDKAGVKEIAFHKHLVKFILEQSVEHTERITYQCVVIIRRLFRPYHQINKPYGQYGCDNRADVFVASADDK